MIVGYQFRPHTELRGYSHKTYKIMNPNILHATNSFINAVFGTNNLSVIHMNVKTKDMSENIRGRESLICDHLLEVNYDSRKFTFRIEKLEVEDYGQKINGK